ncbi:MAG: type II toxin-antitoxin system HicA family toxin [Candidatus Magnetobacterium sp. LHC-1]|uniref:Type II toxin-antitoxin system HicA family toxin n=1 Tax=Candidatus Magnetobacterium casense TaxID=1455061 RepID=A0ABS6RYE9_9BACT|nr:type II toxin-antitoxin system HicA family toxin [Candidatus Magnetobacterium casensis]MBF0606507.1 type II toxin-antitoxin system HicA family toxin [Nitrospirota bacterium]MBV6341669.1 type II toxin-antitoxin system HicA family toxin [Candidatus Magnetobacterium casensis]
MKRDKILRDAINNPANVRFSDFENLLKDFGFECLRYRGSHVIFFSSDYKKLIPVQEGKNGMAKEYQVKQFIRILEENDAI